MAKKVTQMIEEQIQFWMRKNATDKNSSYSGKKKPIITVSREFGAHGALLAAELGDRLGFKVWDKDLLIIISDKLGSSKEYVQSLDEARRGMLEDTIFGFMHQRETNLNYLLYLVKAVRALERFGNSIVVGRGANYICQHTNSFHLRVVSPLKVRIENYAHRENISKEKATAIVQKKDQERANFTKYNFNRDVSNASDYDLILNSSSYSLEEMAELAIEAYHRKAAMEKPLLNHY